MEPNVFRAEDACQIYPIGEVQQTEDGFMLQVDVPFRPGLTKLDQFSHVLVLWWAGEHDNPLTGLIYSPHRHTPRTPRLAFSHAGHLIALIRSH